MAVSIAIIICAVSLFVHVRTQPFKYEFQNFVEKWLLITSSIMIFIAGVYSEALAPMFRSDPKSPWGVVFRGCYLAYYVCAFSNRRGLSQPLAIVSEGIS